MNQLTKWCRQHQHLFPDYKMNGILLKANKTFRDFPNKGIDPFGWQPCLQSAVTASAIIEACKQAGIPIPRGSHEHLLPM